MIRRFLNLKVNPMQQLAAVRSLSLVQNHSSLYSENKQASEDISDEMLKPLPRKFVEKQVYKRLSQSSLVDHVKRLLQCTEQEATTVVTGNKRLMETKPIQISEIVEILTENEIPLKSIIENPWLLSMDEESLQRKIKLVTLLKPRQFEDFLPFLQITHQAIGNLIKVFKRERKQVPEGNRIYYMSKRLEVEPALVSKYIATRTFMFEVNFDMLVKNLDILLEYNMDAITILRDLHVFKYSPVSVRTRLEKCRLAGKEKLKPWMVRCLEKSLDHSIRIMQENKKLLGDRNLIEYISQRLGYDTPTVTFVADRHPAVLKCRVKRVEKILDYLLHEEKFTPQEIMRTIRILVHSLETTKKRLNELRSIGCRPSTLQIVCRSQREYRKFIGEWTDKRENKA